MVRFCLIRLLNGIIRANSDRLNAGEGSEDGMVDDADMGYEYGVHRVGSVRRAEAS